VPCSFFLFFSFFLSTFALNACFSFLLYLLNSLGVFCSLVYVACCFMSSFTFHFFQKCKMKGIKLKDFLFFLFCDPGTLSRFFYYHHFVYILKTIHHTCVLPFSYIVFIDAFSICNGKEGEGSKKHKKRRKTLTRRRANGASSSSSSSSSPPPPPSSFIQETAPRSPRPPPASSSRRRPS